MSTPHFTPDPSPRVINAAPVIRYVSLGAVALAIGALIGAASASAGTRDAADPAPTVTVTAEAETIEVQADMEQLAACQRAVQEIGDIAAASANDVMLPYADVVEILYTQLSNSIDYGPLGVETSEIERGTVILDGIATAAPALSSRTDAVASGDRAVCMG